MNLMARTGNGSFQLLTDPKQPSPNFSADSQEQRGTAPSRAPAGPSLIGAGASFVGRLESNGDVQIEGSVEGEVRGQGVRLGADARIKGTIVGEVAQLSGTVDGNIEAQTVILTKSARVSGDIRYRSLQIEEGAHIDGNCRPLRENALA